MKFLRSFIKIIFWVALLSAMIPFIIWVIFKIVYSNKSISSDEINSNYQVAIVFGAGLYRDGTPTPVLKDRVKTAVDLYQKGKVKKLLFSGDNRFVEYNEPRGMEQYALELGVPQEDIVLDYAGRRTYDTCYRAKKIFKVDQALLITQKFHLPRALFLCDQLGINTEGIFSDLREYPRKALLYWNFREIFATTAAVWDVWFEHPLPVLGEEIPIF